MTKLSSLIAAAILALNATVAFAQPAPTSIEHDGVRYTYTVEQTANARTIRGTTSASNKPFVLYVGNRSVSGTIDGKSVEFPLRDVKRVRGVVEVAAR